MQYLLVQIIAITVNISNVRKYVSFTQRYIYTNLCEKKYFIVLLYSGGSRGIGGFGNGRNAVEQLQVMMVFVFLSYFQVKGCFRIGRNHYWT